METGSDSELGHILFGIRNYAKAYAELEHLQGKHSKYLPFGDQKTGVIAEFYARLYARKVYPKATHIYGTTSEHGWDIKLTVPNKADVYVQVKAVSGHSKTSRISPIHIGWNKLWLLRLDKLFMPVGFWTLEADGVGWAKGTKRHLTMPKHGSPGSGSSEFENATDDTEDFLQVLREALGPEWFTHTEAAPEADVDLTSR
jgi:hypothetical protein